MQLNKRNLILLSLLTLLGMGGIGLGVIVFVEGIPLKSFLSSGEDLPTQLFFGLTYGAGAGILAILAINLEMFEDTSNMFSDMLSEMNPTIPEIIFYSLCAGVGEELLFRGAIQPFLGIWITSILFISLHGYLSITNPTMMLYGAFMVGVSAGLGYLLVFHGMYAAMAGHFAYDVAMFLHLRHQIARDKEE